VSLTTWLKREGFGTYATIDEFAGELARRSTSALGGLGATLASSVASELGELGKGNGLTVCADLVRDLRVPKGARVAALRAALLAGAGPQAAKLFVGGGDLIPDARVSEADRGYLIRSGLKALLDSLPADGLNLELARGAYAAQEAVKGAEAGGIVREVIAEFALNHTGVLTIRHAAFDEPLPAELATRWQDVLTRQYRAAKNAPPAARRLGTAPEWPPVVPTAFAPLMKAAEEAGTGPSKVPLGAPGTGPNTPARYETRSGSEPKTAENPKPPESAKTVATPPPAPPEALQKRPGAFIEYGPSKRPPMKSARPDAAAPGFTPRPRATMSEGPAPKPAADAPPPAPHKPAGPPPKHLDPIRPRTRDAGDPVETYVADSRQVHPDSLRSKPAFPPRPAGPVALLSLRFGEQVHLVATRGTRALERLVAAFDARASNVGVEAALRELDRAAEKRGTEGVNGAMLDELYVFATDPKTSPGWKRMVHALLTHMGPDRAAAIELNTGTRATITRVGEEA